MRKPFYIALAAIGAFVLVAILLAAFFLKDDSEEPVPEPPPVTFPLSEVTELGGGDAVSILLEDGTAISVPQFLSEQQSETASDDNGLDVSYSQNDLYQILYFPNDSYFLVTLLDEPLRDARAAAESEIRTKLRLQDPALCKLNLEVMVASDLNEIYSGRDLGLSFCPGSTELP